MGNTIKRPRRRAFKAVLASTAVAAALVLTSYGPAFAVHDDVFQLDGNVLASLVTSPATSAQTIDWDSFFDSAGAEKPLPTDFTASVFSRDFNTNANGTFNTSDGTTYTTGSKDTLPISTGWQCTASNNVNSKIDVMNAYAAAYTDPATKHQLLYFALERNTNTGDANVAFWFLQDNVACNDNGGTASFTGDHADGDLLIVSAFTNGGTVSNVDVYRWNGGANGSLGTTPVVSTGSDCRTAPSGDSACAIVNTSNITTPWLTANFKDGVGHTLRSTEFYEGGLDLTANNLGGKCFNTFTGDTRSSQSLTATLFDYALGSLGECTSTTETTPNFTTAQIPAEGGTPITASDSAKITVTGIPSFSGTLKFFICGPSSLTSTATCDTGGDQIGSTQTITASGTYPSANATITSVGRYCWRAEFSGDSTAGVPKSSDSQPTECFTVTPRQPTLSTQAGAGPVDFGSAVTDSATLGNTANEPGTGGVGSDGSINPTSTLAKAGGSITFTLYGPDDCKTVAYTSTAVTVNGDGTYNTPDPQFVPTAPGTYHWAASYTGDAPNTLKADHNLDCSDTNEDVVVRQIPTQISTAQSVYPNDSATITSSVSGNNLPTTGTVVFRLYDSLTSCQGGSTVRGTGGLIYDETKSNVPTTAANSFTVSTNNTSVAVSTSSTPYWTVTYATGDTAHTGRQSACAESTALTFTNDAGPGTVYP